MDIGLDAYLENLMISIQGGVEALRVYRDEQKWISSDSRMSIPGKKGNLIGEKITLEIQPFWLAKYPVTRGMYEKVKGITLEGGAEEDLPIVNVTWFEAVEFCNTISKHEGLNQCYSFVDQGATVICDWKANGYRLPSEAEWQYACKAGTSTYRYGEIDQIAWYDQNSEGQLHVVGKKEPNKWGLYDMVGNVWEWCWDLFDENVYGSYRVFRGGSWCEGERGCGATCRRKSHPSFSIDDLGFRLARNL